MIREQFPSPFDVEQTITFQTTPFYTLKQFTQSLGIFSYGLGKKEIADFVSNILLDHKQYLQLRNIALGAEPSISISGFTLRHKLFDVDKDILMNDLIRLRTTINQEKDKLRKDGAPIPKLDMPSLIDDKTIEIHFEYQRVILGRVELIQRVDSEVDFILKQFGKTQWQVVCYPHANQDVKTIQNLFKQMAGGSYEAYTISLESFPQRKRILFFDTLLQMYSKGREWNFEEVTEITIRRPSREIEDNLLFDEDSEDFNGVDNDLDEVENVDREYVESITQAILQGKNLRTNRFVKDCEKKGFYFLTMTLKLTNSGSAEVIEVMVRFKLSPQMFEVILVNTYERDEMGERPSVFSESRQRQILQEFWSTTHYVWRQINDPSLKKSEQQLTFSDEFENQEYKSINPSGE